MREEEERRELHYLALCKMKEGRYESQSSEFCGHTAACCPPNRLPRYQSLSLGTKASFDSNKLLTILTSLLDYHSRDLNLLVRHTHVQFAMLIKGS